MFFKQLAVGKDILPGISNFKRNVAGLIMPCTDSANSSAKPAPYIVNTWKAEPQKNQNYLLVRIQSYSLITMSTGMSQSSTGKLSTT